MFESVGLLTFILLAILFGVLFLALFILVHVLSFREDWQFSLREEILLVAVTIGVFLVLVTEGLSLPAVLTPLAVRLAWSVFWLAAVGSCIALYRREPAAILSLRARS